MAVLLPVGTRKGLFLLRSDESQRAGSSRGRCYRAGRCTTRSSTRATATLYAATNTYIYGGTVQRSTDIGKTWERAEEHRPARGIRPEARRDLARRAGPRAGQALARRRPRRAASLRRRRRDLARWPRPDSAPDARPLGARRGRHVLPLDPARRDDRTGCTSRSPRPARSARDDGGETWTPINKDVAADFIPEKYPEVGQCVHKLLVHPAQPDRLWQQNHCGVYRSDDRGDNWERLDGNGLPSGFGFPTHAPPARPGHRLRDPGGRAASNRVTPDGRLGVYRTARRRRVAGSSPRTGCPTRPGPAVLREAFVVRRRPGGLYFGTQSGSVWAVARRGRRVDRGGARTCRRSSRSKRAVAWRSSSCPRSLAAEAGGQKRFELEAATVGDALRAAPGREPALRRARRAAPRSSTSTSTASTSAAAVCSTSRSPMSRKSGSSARSQGASPLLSRPSGPVPILCRCGSLLYSSLSSAALAALGFARHEERVREQDQLAAIASDLAGRTGRRSLPELSGEPRRRARRGGTRAVRRHGSPREPHGSLTADVQGAAPSRPCRLQRASNEATAASRSSTPAGPRTRSPTSRSICAGSRTKA